MSRTDKDGPNHPRTGLRRLIGGGGPPRRFIRDAWTCRDRQAVRIACRNATKEFHGDRVVDTIPPIDQHRHGAQWLWW
jgi:hypothetical protein